jgi:hypothetical protein
LGRGARKSIRWKKDRQRTKKDRVKRLIVEKKQTAAEQRAASS